ncbi:hypothetical protein ACK87K_17960 [Mycobacterium intracellulare]|uniref:hypothetical protein n=1 Tax=Mycobacterium intracellulare TaxID=1767 RepID=UPI003977797D
MGQTPEEEPPTVSVRVSGPYLYSRATHESLRQLKAELQSDKYQVQIPFAYPHATPQTDTAVAALEQIGIWIGSGVSTAMLTLIAQDIYAGTKRWLRARFNKKADTPASYITIYGPNDKPLKHILAKNADDIREIEPNTHNEEDG